MGGAFLSSCKWYQKGRYHDQPYSGKDILTPKKNIFIFVDSFCSEVRKVITAYIYIGSKG